MIAVDAMGGDFAPNVVLRGAIRASKHQIPMLILGPKSLIEQNLDEIDHCWRSRAIKVQDSSQVILMEDEPVWAFRNKPDSSMVNGIKSLLEGKAFGFVTAGNSGAAMIAANFILKKFDWVSRPAIVGQLPVKDDKIVLCVDIGANVDCKPEYLLDFAKLGEIYSKKFFDVENPKIALLSNGQESCKGNILSKQVYSMLAASKDFNFIGNIEPEAVFDGVADVLICDGFIGNIFLKTIEVCAKVFGNVNFAQKAGGALLLGVNGNVVIAHGNSDEITIENAIKMAYKFSQKEGRYHGVTFKSKYTEDYKI